MLLDLFRNVDYGWRKLTLFKKFIWLLSLLFIYLFLQSYYSSGLFLKKKQLLVKGFKTGSETNYQWRFQFFSNLLFNYFALILYCKLFGLIPYIFGLTTQIVYTLILSVSFWLVIFISSLMFNPFLFFSHLTPLQSPYWLVPLLKVVELIRKLIRPITLRLRLSINMTTGHIFITLISIRRCFCFFFKRFYFFFIVLVFVFYFLFEIFICFIQAFVFGLLINQYLNEHV